MVDDLIALALDDPDEADRRATTLLADPLGTPSERSRAAQALGIAHRERMRFDEALGHMSTAVGLAVESGEGSREADARATYGLTLVVTGSAEPGMSQLDDAVGAAPGDPFVLMRRAVALHYLGRNDESCRDMELAVEGFRAAGDHVWEAHTLHNLGSVELSWGKLDEAEAHTGRALVLLQASGLVVEALWAEQNLGEIRRCRGDLPAALTVFDRVSAGYAQLGHKRPSLDIVRCRAYLAAGLTAEVADLAAVALQRSMEPIDRSLLLLMAANAHLDAGRTEEAVAAAVSARDALGAMGNGWYELRARLVLLRAQRGRGELDGQYDEAEAVARELHRQAADEAPMALVLASEAAGPGEPGSAHLSAAASYRRDGRPVTRAGGWWGAALLADASGSRGGVPRACAAGLDALDEHRRSLGSTELRALATGHGRELATLALRHAATADARTLLRWSERWRATSLAQPPVTPGEEPVLASLAALRDNGRRLAEARAEGEPTEHLEKERSRLEREVRAEHHRQAGSATEESRFDVAQLVRAVGDGCLVELVDVDGVLHVLLVHGGRVRRKVAGTTAEALSLSGSAAFVMRRAARGRPFAPGDLGSRLQSELFGDAASLIPDGPVTVVPTGRLHGVPWALLPVLTDRPFNVVPSAAQWLRARAVVPPAGGTVLVTGPGLGTGGAEVPVLARQHPAARLLDGADATVEAAMGALDGARLAHLACHGRFRADSPLFSSLELADGPLTVHDLERLKVAPHRVVLSACESGVLAPVGADELLGLASALFALGTAGLVCSVAEVNDEATAELMVDLHRHLADGLDPAGALHAVRAARPGDPTALAFVALGV